MTMKFIEDIRDRHKGEEIWVIGAGSSMDEYPINFFEDKICIGINWVFSSFLDVGDEKGKFGSRVFYSIHQHPEPSDWIVKHIPHFLHNCFFLLSAERIVVHGWEMLWWEDYNEDPYYMRMGERGSAGVRATDQDFRDAAKCIVGGGNCHYFSRGTTLHWAIQAAAVLGAKKIYVVGGESQGGHMCKHGSFYVVQREPPLQGIIRVWQEGTRSLAWAFAPYGIDIVYYYYGKGEQAPWKGELLWIGT